MSVVVQIPAALRSECRGAAQLSVSAATVRDALDELQQSHPAIHRSVCDETGALRPHINLFVNSSLVRDRQRLDTALRPGDELAIMTAVSGG